MTDKDLVVMVPAEMRDDIADKLYFEDYSTLAAAVAALPAVRIAALTVSDPEPEPARNFTTLATQVIPAGTLGMDDTVRITVTFEKGTTA